ncbi:MAG TPA: single-stranded DNA-binding protein [Bacillota bacterium]|nr:single-stranded DNA-binding protein [Bacillota bacterium]HOV66049.1 single-stranded DNA-binding protein [Bacillota bacterium]HRC53142.1 single-stranded DNA-binding protein [Bacillota bacterium]
MLNRVILIGRLTRQPELRITPGGTSVTTITLAVDRRPSQGGQKETDFIDVVLFGRLADVTCQYMDKGRLVAVEGRLQSRSWETKDGQKRKSWEVIADSIQFLDGKPKSQDQTANSEEEYSEEDSTFTE